MSVAAAEAGGAEAGAARQRAMSAPRSGVRPMFGGEPRPVPARARAPRSATPGARGNSTRAGGAGRTPAARPSTPSGGGRPATSRKSKSKSKAPPTYSEHVTRERTRRTQSDYRRSARAQVAGERGERPAQTGPTARQRANRAAGYARAGRQLQPSFRNYQGIIIGEFLMAEALVTITPIASRQNVTGLSPYIPRDMTKLLALGLLYFLLSLISVGGGGAARIAAWGGALVLLTVGLNEGANVAKNLDIFDDVKSKVTGKKKTTEPVGED